MKGKSDMVFAPVGDQLQNGFDAGGARIYPFSTGLAISPPAMYQNYIGNADALPVAPPVGSRASTTGVGASSNARAAISSPFSKWSPLPWVIVGMFGAVAAMHVIHYKDRRKS